MWRLSLCFKAVSPHRDAVLLGHHPLQLPPRSLGAISRMSLPVHNILLWHWQRPQTPFHEYAPWAAYPKSRPRRRGQLAGPAAAGFHDSSQQLSPTASTRWLLMGWEGPREPIPWEALMA